LFFFKFLHSEKSEKETKGGKEKKRTRKKQEEAARNRGKNATTKLFKIF